VVRPNVEAVGIPIGVLRTFLERFNHSVGDGAMGSVSRVKFVCRALVGALISVAILSARGASFADQITQPGLLRPIIEGEDAGYIFADASAVEDGTFAEVGLTLALNEDIGKTGWLIAGRLQRNTYSYSNGVTDIHAEVYTPIALLGYQFIFGDNWNVIAAYAGVTHSEIDLSPSVATAEDSTTSLQLQAEVSLSLGSFGAVSSSGVFVDNQRQYWSNARLNIRCSEDFYIGPEVILHGSDEYGAKQFGLFGWWRVNDHMSLGVQVGHAQYEIGTESMYGGIGIGFGI
jgi:hypothetical protein